MAAGAVLVEVVSIGDELLIGQTTNTNAAWMGRVLEAEGWRVGRCVTIADEREVMLEAIRAAESRADLVLITGGLGPTRDDITKHVLCEHYQTTLVRHPDIEARIVTWFERRGRQVLQVNRDQALLPEVCQVLDNPKGTASGMWFDRPGGVTVSMPGVPYEMEHIMTHGVIPSMQARLQAEGRSSVRAHRSLLTMGTGESQLAARVEDLETAWNAAGINMAYLPSPGSVRIRLTAEGEAVQKLEEAHATLCDRLSEFVVTRDGRPVEEALADALVQHRMTLAVAESCTGGALGAALVARPGASAHFVGGVQAYANSAKSAMLGIPEDMLVRHGAVSEPVAKAMAEGARRKLGADWALAITGVAGPDGGTDAKPVGTVFIACAGPDRTVCQRHQFGRDRARNQGMSVRAACQLALQECQSWASTTESKGVGVADSP